MSENREQNSSSEDTSAPEPESIIPEDAVELETTEADHKVTGKLKDAEAPDHEAREMIIDPLSRPFRAVIWFTYEELRERFDTYWDEVIVAALEGKTVSITASEKKLIQSLRIKGKRKKGGKIANAKKMAESRVSPVKLYYRVLGDVLREKIQEKGTDVLYVEGLDLFDFDKGKQPQLVAVYHPMPVLELGDEIDWRCKRPQMPPKQEQFEMRLKEIQRQHRTLKDDPGGVIGENSNVCMDMRGTVEGETYPSATMKRQWLEVGFIQVPELRDHLLGKKVGDEFECEFPASKHDPDHGGKPVSASIKILDLQQIDTPDVDDDLAKDAGFDDLKAFEERFDKDYAGYIKRAEQATVADHVVKDILRKAPIPPLPMSWVNLQVEGLMQEHLASVKGSKSQAMKLLGVETEDEYVENFRRQLYQQFMQELALQKYGQMFDVEPGSDEMFSSMMEKVRWDDEKEA